MPTPSAAMVGRAWPGSALEFLATVEVEPVEDGAATWLTVRHGDVTGWVWAPLVGP